MGWAPSAVRLIRSGIAARRGTTHRRKAWRGRPARRGTAHRRKAWRGRPARRGTPYRRKARRGRPARRGTPYRRKARRGRPALCSGPDRRKVGRGGLLRRVLRGGGHRYRGPPCAGTRRWPERGGPRHRGHRLLVARGRRFNLRERGLLQTLRRHARVRRRERPADGPRDVIVVVRRHPDERELHRTDGESVPITQLLLAPERLPVELRAVGAAHVLGEVPPVARQDARVLPGDTVVVQHQVVLRGPADLHFGLLEGELPSDLEPPGDGEQDGQRTSPRRCRT